VIHRLRFVPLLALLAACSGSASHPVGLEPPPDRAATTPPVISSLPELAPDPREALLAHGVAMMLTQEHLRNRPLDDALSKEAFAEYLKRLDAGKLFLLKGHVAELEKFSDRIDDELREGDLELARKGAALLQQRRRVVAKIVAEILAQPLDLDDAEEVETDADKIEYVATEAELRERWRQMLELQVLERISQMEATRKALADKSKEPDAGEAVTKPLEEIPATFEAQEKKARGDMARSYDGRFTRLEDIDPLEPAERYLNAVATVYDPHTQYLAPADKENFDIQMSGSLEGIGAVLGEDDHYIVVREVVPGGASARQGKLEAGDLILAVAQEGDKPVDVADMPIDKVVKLIRGPKGTKVTLTVKKPDDKIEVIAITRDVVEIEAAYARGALLDLGPGRGEMGYVLLPSFYGNTRAERGNTGERNATDDVRALLEIFAKKKVSGVIIDLRGNGGGLLGHARDITGLLIDTGPVVQTRYSNGKGEILEDDEAGVAFGGDVVVLVDRFSASASEILAAALQDYRRAIIVGTGPTHGKGTVQVLVDLDRLRRMQGGDPLGVLKLTIQQYFRVDGDSVQWRGVVPDIVLSDPAGHIESGERSLDHSIPWSKTTPLVFTRWNRGNWDAKALSEKSKQRRAASPLFSKIDARTKLLVERRDKTRVSIQREAWKTRRASDEAALEAVDPKLKEIAPLLTVKLVEYDGSPAAPAKNGAKSRLDEWKDEIARDPWVAEAMTVLGEMKTP
jgi:carboxyl-terminal processing protease